MKNKDIKIVIDTITADRLIEIGEEHSQQMVDICRNAALPEFDLEITGWPVFSFISNFKKLPGVNSLFFYYLYKNNITQLTHSVAMRESGEICCARLYELFPYTEEARDEISARAIALYIAVQYIYVNNPECFLHVTQGHTITCEKWEVSGHWRTYKSGKKVYIKPYSKGKKKDVKGYDR